MTEVRTDWRKYNFRGALEHSVEAERLWLINTMQKVRPFASLYRTLIK